MGGLVSNLHKFLALATDTRQGLRLFADVFFFVSRALKYQDYSHMLIILWIIYVAFLGPWTFPKKGRSAWILLIWLRCGNKC